MDILKEVDWTCVDDEDIPCFKTGENHLNKNLWFHPSGEIRRYMDWWYLDDSGLPANAVDGGFLLELKGTEEIADYIDQQFCSATMTEH